MNPIDSNKPVETHAGAVLKILKQALTSWDATESDLADAASIFMVPPPEALQSACSATQAVVDALIRIVETERPQPGVKASPKGDAGSSGNPRAQTLAFVANFVTAGRATVQLQDVLPILECLAEGDEVSIGPKHSSVNTFLSDTTCMAPLLVDLKRLFRGCSPNMSWWRHWPDTLKGSSDRACAGLAGHCDAQPGGELRSSAAQCCGGMAGVRRRSGWHSQEGAAACAGRWLPAGAGSGTVCIHACNSTQMPFGLHFIVVPSVHVFLLLTGM